MQEDACMCVSTWRKNDYQIRLDGSDRFSALVFNIRMHVVRALRML